MANSKGKSVVLIAILASAACEPAPDLSSPQKYVNDTLGLSFAYPGNWEMSDEGPGFIVVGSAAMWDTASLSVLHFDAATNEHTMKTIAVELAADRRQATAELPDGVANAPKGEAREIPPAVKGGSKDGLEFRYDFEALGSASSFVEQLHRVDGADRVYFLQAHTPRDDWERAKPGFQLIYDTFEVAGEPVANIPRHRPAD